jgi:hypothetical protein
MGKGRQVLVVAIFLAAAGGIGWMLLSSVQPEPVYNGKPLSYWVEGYDTANYNRTHPNGPGPPTWNEANEAVRKAGTNAIPILLRALHQRDSKVKEAVLNLLRKQHVIKIPLPSTTEYIKALDGFRTLGAEASNAVPGLIVMFDHDPSPTPQTAIPAILGDLGPPAKAAVPAMLRGMTHTNVMVRNNAIYALRKIKAEPKLVVPELLKALKDPEIMVRAQAIRALRDFGTDARDAVPALLEIWRKELPLSAISGRLSSESWIVSSGWVIGPFFGTSLPDLHSLAAEALRAIDPGAAEKAGVEQNKK